MKNYLSIYQAKKRDFSYPLDCDYKLLIPDFAEVGYDYASIKGSQFYFSKCKVKTKKTISQNDSAIITDGESFKKYNIVPLNMYNYSVLEKLAGITGWYEIDSMGRWRSS